MMMKLLQEILETLEEISKALKRIESRKRSSIKVTDIQVKKVS